MQALILAAMTWIASETGLPVPDSPPGVTFVSAREMATRAHPEGRYDPTVAGRYLALYHPESRTILLRDDWKRHDLRDRSILVHELVHHMQAAAGRRYACRGARERVAYETQARWLEQRGAHLFRVLGLNRLFYYLITTC